MDITNLIINPSPRAPVMDHLHTTKNSQLPLLSSDHQPKCPLPSISSLFADSAAMQPTKSPSASSVSATSNKGYQKSQIPVIADCISNQSSAHVGFYTSPTLDIDLYYPAAEPFAPATIAAPGPDTRKRYICQTCNKPFLYSSRLRTHLCSHTAHMRKSKGEKPFHCESAGCEKAFSQRCDLNAHMRIHTGEKPFRFQSAGCEKAFSHYSSLNAHMCTHTDEKPFHCESCGKAFLHRSGPRSHRKYCKAEFQPGL